MSVEGFVLSHLHNILEYDPMVTCLENSILENRVRCLVHTLKVVQHFVG